MPKNFRITSSRDGSRQFKDIDMPVPHTSNKPNFKAPRNNNNNNNNYRRGGNGRNFHQIPNSLTKILEDDAAMEGVAMGHFQHGKRIGPRKNMRGGAFSRLGPSHMHNGVPVSESNWYRVEVPHGRTLGKDFILQSIMSNSKEQFVPAKFEFKKECATFYVMGHTEASAIKEVSQRVTTPTGHKMMITVCATSVPKSDITSEVITKIKEVMVKRYVTSTSSLNLSNFVKDPDFVHNCINLSMNMQKLISTLLDIISNHVSQLKNLDLSSNELQRLDCFSLLHEKAPNLVFLNLSNNKLRLIHDLGSIKRLKLEEIVLDGNPFQTKFKDKQLYVKAVRQKLPNILKLDNQILPPPITFKVESLPLPPSQGSYFGGEMVQSQICVFIQQYFGIYDSADREPLFGAYHENATFSLSFFSTRTQNSGSHSGHWSAYTQCNRNLKKINDEETFTRLKTGRNTIIPFLKTLPSTSHNLQSFVVDVTLINTSMLVFSLKGVFTEAASSSHAPQPMRHFNRVVVAVPNGEGLAIINEMVVINNLSSELRDKYRTANCATPKECAPSTSNTPANPPEPFSSQQKEMVLVFSQQSGMNEHYSALCLAENGWNFEKAAMIFSELQRSGSIPPDAFVR